MAQIVNPDIEAYLRRLYDDGAPVRRDLEALAAERPLALVVPLGARALVLRARGIGARKAYELGSGFGYPAPFLANAVGPVASVQCTDLSEETQRLAQELLTRAGVWSRITYHREEATG